MPQITTDHLTLLKDVEAHVHYGEPPPPEQLPFVVISRNSRVMISAPHGARTFRGKGLVSWHEEDEYTAGMALLLSELCDTSVVANIWRSDTNDPNFHGEAYSEYKEALKKVVADQHVRWVLDLHGARPNNSKLGGSLVDLGTRKEKHSLNPQRLNIFDELLKTHLKVETISYDAFPALHPPNNTITEYCQEELRIEAVQIEMTPAVRVLCRRVDASAYARSGPFSAEPDQVLGMLRALAAFIAYLDKIPEVDDKADREVSRPL